MKYLFFVCITNLFAIAIDAQCSYETNVPKEYYRGRYEPVEADISYPFTMFNKRKAGYESLIVFFVFLITLSYKIN